MVYCRNVSLLQRMRTVYSEKGGFSAMYRGLAPGSIRSFIANGTSMIVMSYAQRKVTDLGLRDWLLVGSCFGSLAAVYQSATCLVMCDQFFIHFTFLHCRNLWIGMCFLALMYSSCQCSFVTLLHFLCSPLTNLSLNVLGKSLWYVFTHFFEGHSLLHFVSPVHFSFWCHCSIFLELPCKDLVIMPWGKQVFLGGPFWRNGGSDSTACLILFLILLLMCL